MHHIPVSQEKKIHTYSYGGLARAGGGSRYAWKNIIHNEKYSCHFNIIAQERYFTVISTTLEPEELQNIYIKYIREDVKNKNRLGGKKSVEVRKKLRKQMLENDI
jgi:hypothetical protein